MWSVYFESSRSQRYIYVRAESSLLTRNGRDAPKQTTYCWDCSFKYTSTQVNELARAPGVISQRTLAYLVDCKSPTTLNTNKHQLTILLSSSQTSCIAPKLTNTSELKP